MSTLRLFRPVTSSIARLSAAPLSKPAFRSFHATVSKMTVHNIQNIGEFKDLIKTQPVVVVDWFATWCGPCKMIAPEVAKLSNANEDIFFAKVDVDEIPDLAQEYGITAMPTFTFIKGGETVDSIRGANPVALQKLVVKHKPEAKATEEKPAEEKPAEEKPAEEKPAEEKKAEEEK